MKKLISKCEVLEARIGESQRLYESKVKSAEDEASRSKRRARRQLEADERQVQLLVPPIDWRSPDSLNTSAI